MGKIGNAVGVAGLKGNLHAESGLRSDNLRNSFAKKLGWVINNIHLAWISGLTKTSSGILPGIVWRNGLFGAGSKHFWNLLRGGGYDSRRQEWKWL